MEGGPKSLNSGLKGPAAPGTEPDGDGTLPAARGASKRSARVRSASSRRSKPRTRFAPIPSKGTLHSRPLNFRTSPPPAALSQQPLRDHAHFTGQQTEARRGQAAGLAHCRTRAVFSSETLTARAGKQGWSWVLTCRDRGARPRRAGAGGAAGGGGDGLVGHPQLLGAADAGRPLLPGWLPGL